MKVNDRVAWSSQSQSHRTVKRGRIVAVVPSHTEPYKVMPDGFRSNSTCGFGMGRNHESYLVKVDGKGRGLYWPRVCLLKLEPSNAF